jgi:hypothetical protein
MTRQRFIRRPSGGSTRVHDRTARIGACVVFATVSDLLGAPIVAASPTREPPWRDSRGSGRNLPVLTRHRRRLRPPRAARRARPCRRTADGREPRADLETAVSSSPARRYRWHHHRRGACNRLVT